MAIASGTAATIALVTGLVGTAASAYGSYQSAQAQQQQAAYQSKMAAYNAQVAEKNAQLAEEQGRQAKKEGYENKLKKRQEVAGVIGAQRAAQGASGGVVDVGSNLDVNLDTTEKGEIDALKLEQQGLDADYQQRLQAWNYRAQGAASSSASKQYSQVAGGINPWVNAGSTLLGGLANVGNNYYTMTKGMGTPKSTLTREEQGLDPYGWQH